MSLLEQLIPFFANPAWVTLNFRKRRAAYFRTAPRIPSISRPITAIPRSQCADAAPLTSIPGKRERWGSGPPCGNSICPDLS